MLPSVLDHFYSTIPSKLFDDLIPLSDLFNHSYHSRISRPDVSYEGIYIFFGTHEYLELLRDEGQRYISFCLQLEDQNANEEAVRIAEENPQLQLGDMRQYKDKDGNYIDAFRALRGESRTLDGTELLSTTGGFSPWIMLNYQQSDNRIRNRLGYLTDPDFRKKMEARYADTAFKWMLEPIDLGNLLEVVFVAPPKYSVETIVELLNLLGLSPIIEDEKVTVVIKSLIGEHINFVFITGTEKNFGLKSITTEINSGYDEKFTDLRIGLIDFIVSGNKLTMKFDDYYL